MIHYWSAVTKKMRSLGVGEFDDACGVDNSLNGENHTDKKKEVTCPDCLKVLTPPPSPEEPAVEALKSYAKLAVLAERERICKMLEKLLEELRGTK